MKLPCYFRLNSYKKSEMFVRLISVIYWDWLKEEKKRNFFLDSNFDTSNKKESINENTRLIEDLHLSQNGCKYFSILMSLILNRRIVRTFTFREITIKQFSEEF